MLREETLRKTSRIQYGTQGKEARGRSFRLPGKRSPHQCIDKQHSSSGQKARQEPKNRSYGRPQDSLL